MSSKVTTQSRGRKGAAGMKFGIGHGQSQAAARKHVLGTTAEGIDILKPRGNPSSFTWQELREAVANVIEKSPA